MKRPRGAFLFNHVNSLSVLRVLDNPRVMQLIKGPGSSFGHPGLTTNRRFVLQGQSGAQSRKLIY